MANVTYILNHLVVFPYSKTAGRSKPYYEGRYASESKQIGIEYTLSNFIFMPERYKERLEEVARWLTPGDWRVCFGQQGKELMKHVHILPCRSPADMRLPPVEGHTLTLCCKCRPFFTGDNSLPIVVHQAGRIPFYKVRNESFHA